MIKAVIFDLDGVLIESEVRTVLLKKEIIEKHGITWTRDLSVKLAGLKFAEVLNNVLSDIDDETRKAIHDEYYARAYGGKTDYHALETKGASELLRRLKADGYVLAMATSSDLDKIGQVLEENGWEGIFDVIMDAGSVSRKKPDPEVYLKAMEKLGCKADEVIIVEDSHTGILSGVASGARVICRVENRYECDQSGADFYINDLGEIENIVKSL